MKQHQEQAARLKSLGISHRGAAKDLGVAASTFSRYMLRGHLPDQLKADTPGRVDRYLKMKEVEARRGSNFIAAPINGRFILLGVTMEKLSELTGMERNALKRGIYDGRWPDEATYRHIVNSIERELCLDKEERMLTKKALPDEVVEYFNLRADPFTDDVKGVDDILDTPDLIAAEKKIMTAVDRARFVAVTGERGTGKTVLLKKVRSRLAKRQDVVIVDSFTVEKEHLGASGILDAIMEDLGATWSKNHRLEMRARYVANALKQKYADGQKVVLVIDEAHLLPDQTLLALKRLFEFEVNFKRLLAIVLVGQPALASRLKTNVALAEVAMRVDLFKLRALNGAFAHYLNHKLQRAGMNGKQIFDSSALKAIHDRMKKGELLNTPLALNNLAADAMIAAWDVREKKVTAAMVEGV